MLTVVSALVLAPAALDAVKLIREYKAEDSQAFHLVATADMGGGSMKVDTEIVFKVKKTTTDGAEVSMSARKFKLIRDGADENRPAPDEMTSPFDKLGLPHVMSTENEAWVYILASMAGLVPGKEVELGHSFDVKWTSRDGALSVNGKGKALEVVEHEGTKAIKIEYDLEVKPGSETPGYVKCTTLVAQEGSSPISTNGSVSVDEGKISFTVKRLKA